MCGRLKYYKLSAGETKGAFDARIVSSFQLATRRRFLSEWRPGAAVFEF